MPLKPANFDGEKFAKKYNLDPFLHFYDDGKGNIICPSLPNLTDADLLDCVLDPPSPYDVFKKPIITPAVYAEDIYVSSRKIKDNPDEAFAEALAEAVKGDGEPKSLDLISRSTLRVLEHAMSEIENLRLEIDQLKKKVK